MSNNIIRKTPSGNFMILNYARMSKDGYTMRVPLVSSLSKANHFELGVTHGYRFCIISKNYYDKL